ncbi:helix-turn-helix domain-containing protein [Gandjariella thermophila]|uniref:Transcriptional regulator n=1 Tax=Gandjariella thermophila TaxID=1931992 RepID=A0A4D4J6F6_9PSEU|nr:helix-turn-helix transcriptional regulator [Gandjariella thermophila]GDY29523.1 transcriptional regulator [Gandjariella thermophila]
MSDDEKVLGRKIATERRKRGLSQKELGALLDRSETWVSQVERGVRKIDRMSVLERIADVLEVPLSELAPTAPVVAAATDKPRVVSDLALVLTSSNALRAVLTRPREVNSADLESGAVLAWEYAHGSSYEKLGEMLLELIPQLETGARAAAGDDKKNLFGALAKTYHAAAAVLSKVGEFAAAWVAADRAINAAERSDDPLLMAEGAFRLTLVFQGARWLDLARTTAETAEETLSTLDGSADPAVYSLRGALNLQLAVIAARSDDANEAYARLEKAARFADELGADRNDYDTEFGPTNVKLHEVAVALELGDAGRALRVGEAVNASNLSAERQGRLLIDLARAHAQRRNVDGVVSALRSADRIAPEQVRNHPLVRALMDDLGQTAAADDPEFADLAAQLYARPSG